MWRQSAASQSVKWNSALILHVKIMSRLDPLWRIAAARRHWFRPVQRRRRTRPARKSTPPRTIPFEPTNRYVFDVNLAVMDMAINPIATIYREGVPEPYRNGVRNFLDNLQMPVTLLNSALQGDWDNTAEASMSFFINTTAGLGGIFDIPGSFDEEPRKADFRSDPGRLGRQRWPLCHAAPGRALQRPRHGRAWASIS